MSSEQTIHTFHVSGMHCNSCVLMIEDTLGELPYITNASSSLNHNSVTVKGDFGTKTKEEIAREFTSLLKENGYTVSVEENEGTKIVKWSEFIIAIPIALFFLALFVLLQKLGIVNIINADKVTYGTAFLVGIVASLSTCMAVVGGLLLSMSATFAKEGDAVKPQAMFHLGRIVSFFVLGGIIGVIGSAFTLNITATFVLNFLVGFVMLFLGINLMDVFPWGKRFQVGMPKFIAKRAHKISSLNHTLTPLLVGIATFFLPCGFTQSMQLYTLTTGGFVEGGLTMLFFALGTFPVLALLSFSSLSISKSKYAGVFFKSVGLIVILFALFNIINSLVAVGIVPPLFSI
ncbi:MAG: uncharacterized protein QG653_65 [Patescibacteria group bacterium]|nr:uncharacterized protein [Patescibacteria group bacterium]